MPLSLASSGAAISALAWTLNYPSADIQSVQVTIGSQATAAQKSLICNGNTCLLSGSGTSYIADGTIATLTIKLASKPADANVPLTISGLSASDGAGSAVTIGSKAGNIAVNQVQPPTQPTGPAPPTTGGTVGIQTVTSAISGTGNSFTATFASKVTAGHTVLAFVTWVGDPGPSANCADTLKSVYAIQNGTLDPVNKSGAALFSAKATGGGLNKVTVSLGGSVISRRITIVELP